MRNPQYKLNTSENLTTFEFISEGPKGLIPKIVRYTKIDVPNLYNLGFGDKLGDTEDFDDKIITDNKDSEKVLTTVARTIFLFTNNYTDAYVLITGSTPSRTRLYQIGISNHLEDILKDFEVIGVKNTVLEKFKKNQNYEAFLIIRKWN